MPSEKNLTLVKEIKNKIEDSTSLIFADFKGLSTTSITEIRTKLKELNSTMQVAKNTLTKKALVEKDYDISQAEQYLQGSTAIIYCKSDITKLLKLLFDYAKKLELPKIKFAYFESTFIGANQAELLSKLPSKEQLIATAIGTLKNPVTRFVGSLKVNQRKLVYALNSIAKQKEV